MCKEHNNVCDSWWLKGWLEGHVCTGIMEEASKQDYLKGKVKSFLWTQCF